MMRIKMMRIKKYLFVLSLTTSSSFAIVTPSISNPLCLCPDCPACLSFSPLLPLVATEIDNAYLLVETSINKAYQRDIVPKQIEIKKSEERIAKLFKKIELLNILKLHSNNKNIYKIKKQQNKGN